MADANPMNCNQKAWKDFKTKEKSLIKKIDSWNFSFLTGDQMIRHGVTDRQHHDEVSVELKKFLAIKVLRDPHPMGCFGPQIGAAWHAFILDTQRYEEFCKKTYGKTIHHKPSNYGAGVQDNSLWMAIYKEWFGDFPRVWKLELNGQEIPGYEHDMNVKGNVASSDMDSDDGAYP